MIHDRSTKTTEFAIAYQVTGRVTANLKIECRPGMITLLDDEIGHFADRCREAMAAFANGEGQLVFRRGEAVSAEVVALVGVGERLPHIMIPEYLRRCGAPVEKVPELIRDAELIDYEHLFCDVLPAIPARKLALLGALHNNSPIIVLNDPFQPFSGRWRESLGQQLLQQATDSGRSIVCLNVGFVPKCWSTSQGLVRRDLRRLTEDAITAREVELERLQALAEAAARAEEEAAKKKAAQDELRYASDREEVIGKGPGEALQTSLPVGSYAIMDRLLGPLTIASKLMGSWSRTAAVACVTFLVLAMGTVMFPNVVRDHATLRLLAEKLPVSWQQIFSLNQPQPPEEVNSDPQVGEDLPPSAEVEDPEGVQHVALPEPVEDTTPVWDDFATLSGMIEDDLAGMCRDRMFDKMRSEL